MHEEIVLKVNTDIPELEMKEFENDVNNKFQIFTSSYTSHVALFAQTNRAGEKWKYY